MQRVGKWYENWLAHECVPRPLRIIGVQLRQRCSRFSIAALIHAAVQSRWRVVLQPGLGMCGNAALWWRFLSSTARRKFFDLENQDGRRPP